jgi:esterase/lipase superfamily enzyme
MLLARRRPAIAAIELQPETPDNSKRGVGAMPARIVVLVLAAVALAGCASFSEGGGRLEVAELLNQPTLLVATTRKPVNGARAAPWFGPERGRLSLARVKLSPPGEGRFSRAAIGLGGWRLGSVETVPHVNDLLKDVTTTRDVLLYVHGYNQTFETGAIHAAQLAQGLRFGGETMLFSWPSKASLLDYGYDRESAMWSRDSLEQVLAKLIAAPATARIHIVAHSVGTMLAMEALRQIYARRADAVASRIGAVIFAAPDIDMDVFASSVERIGPLAARITVIAATNDRALALSGWIAGGVTRVGAAEQAQLKELGLHVIDTSGQGLGVINHDSSMSDPRILQVIRRALDGRPPDAPEWQSNANAG